MALPHVLLDGLLRAERETASHLHCIHYRSRSDIHNVGPGEISSRAGKDVSTVRTGPSEKIAFLI